MITGVHALIYSRRRRRFARCLGSCSTAAPSTTARGGDIRAAAGRVAVHPTDGEGHHELYLMCDDVEATIAAWPPRASRADRWPTAAGAC